ncbi:hypothetical protein RQP46_004926 [Phenoliferia psychrophenolica]
MENPPRQGLQSAQPLSPEQIRRVVEDNRIRAKAKVQERDRQARENALRPSHATNANAKRPLQVVPADSTSPTAPASRTNSSRVAPGRAGVESSGALQNAVASGSGGGTGTGHFKRDDGTAPLKNMIGQYVEFDLSTLKNSKGGFMLENEDDDPRRVKERQLIEENKLKRLEAARKAAKFEAPVSMDPKQNPKCVHCASLDLDQPIRDNFGVLVCRKCKDARPEEYSLLTKTECKEDYLLTDPELKDAELLPHLLRANPHRPTYSNMMLFLRLQVEAFAFSDKKWGSPEALDAEFARRELEKKDKKAKKFETKLRELRKKTRTNVWHRRVDAEHRHDFGEATTVNAEGSDVQTCAECGFEVEVEVF